MTASIDELLHTARSTVHRLNGIRTDNGRLIDEYTQCSKRINESNVNFKMPNGIELLMLGIEDASCTAQLLIQMQLHESDRQRSKMQIQRLSGEIKWLRDELTRLRTRFSESEQDRVKMEVELDHYKFKEQLQCTDNSAEETVQASTTDDCNLSEGLERSLSTNTLCSNTSSMYNTLSTGYCSNGNDVTNGTTPRLRTLHNLVVHYASQRRYDVAVPLCRQTLEDLENTIGRNHPDVAMMLNVLALVYRDQNKFREASELLKEALAIREQYFGLDNPAVAATLNNLAVLQARRRKYKEAEALGRRALAIREKHLGLDSPDVAKQLVNLALICLNQCKFKETISCYQRAINIYSKKLGHVDPIVLKTKVSLASAYIRSNKYIESENILRNVVLCMNDQTNGHCDSQIVMSVAKTAANLYKCTDQSDIVVELDAMINGGAGHLKELLNLLGSTLNDEKVSSKLCAKDSQIGKSNGGTLHNSLSFAKLRATIRLCSSSILFNSKDVSQSNSILDE